MASKFSGSSGGDRRPPPARPFSGSAGAGRTPAIRPVSTGRRQTVAPFSAIEPGAGPDGPGAEPGDSHAASIEPYPGAQAAAPAPAEALGFSWQDVAQAPEPTPPDLGTAFAHDPQAGEGSEPESSALRVHDLYEAPLRPDTSPVDESDATVTWDLFPEEPGPAMEQAPAPGPESSTPESFDAGIEWASFVGGTSGGGDDPGKDAGVEPATEAEAAYQTDPAASFDVAPERPWDVPVSGDDPDLLGDSLAAIEPPASGRVPDESWFAESSGGPAEVPPAGGEEYAIGPDLSGYAGVSPPPVAPDGAAGATHAAEMLEAVARMVRSGEIVVSATPGATAESVLASILASLLSPPS